MDRRRRGGSGQTDTVILIMFVWCCITTCVIGSKGQVAVGCSIWCDESSLRSGIDQGVNLDV